MTPNLTPTLQPCSWRRLGLKLNDTTMAWYGLGLKLIGGVEVRGVVTMNENDGGLGCTAVGGRVKVAGVQHDTAIAGYGTTQP